MSEEKLIGYVFDLTTAVGESQSLTVKGNLALGATKEEMSKEFDKLIAVTDRLAAKHKAERKRGEVAGDEFQISAMKADLALLDERKDAQGNPLRLSQAEKNNREAMVRNIRHLEARKAGYESDLAALLKQAE